MEMGTLDDHFLQNRRSRYLALLPSTKLISLARLPTRARLILQKSCCIYAVSVAGPWCSASSEKTLADFEEAREFISSERQVVYVLWSTLIAIVPLYARLI